MFVILGTKKTDLEAPLFVHLGVGTVGPAGPKELNSEESNQRYVS